MSPSPQPPTIEAFGAGARLHHVGVVVARIADHELGAMVEAIHDPLQRVRVAFVSLAGTTIELVEPAADDSPVMSSLRKGSKLLHLCFEVPDLERALAESRDHGFHALGPPQPAVAFGGRRIAWCFSPVFGLVELLEAEP